MSSLAYLRKLLNSQELILYLCFFGFLIYPVSNSVGQVPLYIASIHWIRLAFQKKLPFLREDLFWLGGFVLIVGASQFYSIRPEFGVDKWNRILLFGLPLGLPLLGKERGDYFRVITIVGGAVCLGGIVLFVYDSVRIFLEVNRGVHFFDAGDMTSPQFFMVALILSLGFVADDRFGSIPKWLVVVIVLVLIGGIILHNKRGVWISVVVGLSVFFIIKGNWKGIFIVAGIVGLALLLPSVQDRLNDLRNIFDVSRGDRVVLWKDVAPEIIPQYPYGLGFNASANSDFLKYTDSYLQPNLAHLHNNLLQIRLELGWHGVIFWVSWMGRMLFRLLGGLNSVRKTSAFPSAGLAIFCSIVALLVNGMVEYNFGDSEIFTLYLVLFGLAGIFSKPVLAQMTRQGEMLEHRD